MPAYELYLDGLREGFFKDFAASAATKEQLHVILAESREFDSIQSV